MGRSVNPQEVAFESFVDETRLVDLSWNVAITNTPEATTMLDIRNPSVAGLNGTYVTLRILSRKAIVNAVA
jgi:hypothetical protein